MIETRNEILVLGPDDESKPKIGWPHFTVYKMKNGLEFEIGIILAPNKEEAIKAASECFDGYIK